MRVCSWNVHAGVGTDGRYDLERIAAVLREVDADVVGLQEVDVRFDARSRSEDMVQRLGELTGRSAVFAPAIVRGEGAYGLALLTREPAPLTVHALPASLDEQYAEPRVVLESNVQGVQVLLTHLQWRPTGDRAAQWDALARRVQRPGIVLGDLNEDPGPLAKRARLVDATRSAGTTFPSDRPRKRIDAVLVTPDLQASRPRRVRTTASDHLPVVVEVDAG